MIYIPTRKLNIFISHNGENDWNYVGTWYTSGSNTCVFSRPTGRPFTDSEFAPTEHVVITSNRQWREEEFLIAPVFTRGTDQIDVKIEYVPNTKELFPGQLFPTPSAWSEARYWIEGELIIYTADIC